MIANDRFTCSDECAAARIEAGAKRGAWKPSTPERKAQLQLERWRRKNHKRRAVLLAAYVEDVEPLKVYERDNWRCHLCGLRVDKRLKGTHQQGPTLDHLVPLSRGGEHSYANVALAHRACNTAKGARPSSFQTFLFA